MSLLYARMHAGFTLPRPVGMMRYARRLDSTAPTDSADSDDSDAQTEQTEQGRSVRTTWNYTLSSIVFFFVFLDFFVLMTMTAWFSASPEPLAAALLVATLLAAAMQVRYCWFLRAGRGGGLPHPAWTAALIAPAALVWVLGLLAPGGAVAAWVPMWMAACLIACLLPGWRRWATLVVAALVSLAHPVLAVEVFGQPIEPSGESGVWAILIYSATLPFMVLTSIWWWEIVVTLDRHRRVAAELAVTRERLRFASDLHDIQGHHLQVISLKSELAERLLAIDPEAAREHLHETRMIAKQALEETRSLVAGYREIALDDELENAREVLAAAGARCELHVESLPSDAAAQSVLATVVREATTNILRHSTATQVDIRLAASDDFSTLVIGNDGVMQGTDAPAASGRAASSGLAGLRERVTALGGRLEASTDDTGGRFTLSVRVPTAAVAVVAGGARGESTS